MRLTHTRYYKDKRKNREPLTKIRNKLFEIENIEDKYNIASTDDLEKRLKALEIIKEKGVDVLLIKQLTQSKHGFEQHRKPLTQEEYELLKELL